MRGYINIDSDGVKTYRQIMYELWNMIQLSKVNRRTTTLRFNTHIMHVTYVDSKALKFSSTEPYIDNNTNEKINVFSFSLGNTLNDCNRISHTIIPSSNSIVYADDTLAVAPPSYHFYIYY